MPTYQYRCKNCRYEFEEFQKMSDNPLIMCPECQNRALTRVIVGGAGLVFKGTGFYITDYRKDNKSDTTSASKKEPAKTDKKNIEKDSDSKKKI